MSDIKVAFEGQVSLAAQYAREISMRLRQNGIDVQSVERKPEVDERSDAGIVVEIIVRVAEHTTALLVAECLMSYAMRNSKIAVLLGSAHTPTKQKMSENVQDASKQIEELAKMSRKSEAETK